jgi:hypothetical protein
VAGAGSRRLQYLVPTEISGGRVEVLTRRLRCQGAERPALRNRLVLERERKVGAVRAGWGESLGLVRKAAFARAPSGPAAQRKMRITDSDYGELKK